MILKSNSQPDRRRRRRQLLNTSVQVFSGSIHVDAIGINLSDVGMCLFAIANLPIGSEIQVDFLPPRSSERLRVQGVIRHRALYLYGIEFLVEGAPITPSAQDFAAAASGQANNSRTRTAP